MRNDLLPPITLRTAPVRRLGHDSAPMLFFKPHIFYIMMAHNDLLETPQQTGLPYVQCSSTACSPRHNMNLYAAAPARCHKNNNATQIFPSALASRFQLSHADHWAVSSMTM